MLIVEAHYGIHGHLEVIELLFQHGTRVGAFVNIKTKLMLMETQYKGCTHMDFFWIT
jgi:hypothetical protein